MKKHHNMSIVKTIVMVIDNAYGNFILMRMSMRLIMIDIIVWIIVNNAKYEDYLTGRTLSPAREDVRLHGNSAELWVTADITTEGAASRVCSVQCAVCCVQCVVCSVPCAVCSV